MTLFRPTITHQRRAPAVTEPADDAALYGRVSVDHARAHLASLTPARRAELEREWI